MLVLLGPPANAFYMLSVSPARLTAVPLMVTCLAALVSYYSCCSVDLQQWRRSAGERIMRRSTDSSQRSELRGCLTAWLAGSLAPSCRKPFRNVAIRTGKALVRLLPSTHARDTRRVDNEKRHLPVSHDDCEDESATCRDADELS